MDDDNDDWFSGAAEAEPEPAPAPAAKGGKKKAKEVEEAPADDAPAEEEAAAEETAPLPEADPESEYLDPDKLILFKHWKRPRYLQYKYLEDYRRNYYDDVLEAIESRRKGYRRAIPRPQTWAERILRSHSHPVHKLETFDRFLEDVKLVTRSEVSGRIYSYQAMQSVNKRYSTRISY